MAYTQEQINSMSLAELQSIIDNEEVFNKLSGKERRLISSAKGKLKNEVNSQDIIETRSEQEEKPVKETESVKNLESKATQPPIKEELVNPVSTIEKKSAKSVADTTSTKDVPLKNKPVSKPASQKKNIELKAAIEKQKKAKENKTMESLSWKESEYACEYIRRKAVVLSRTEGYKVTQHNVVQMILEHELEIFNQGNYVFYYPNEKANSQKTAAVTEDVKQAIRSIVDNSFVDWSKLIRSMINIYIKEDKDNPMDLPMI